MSTVSSSPADARPDGPNHEARRQVLYWRLLAGIFADDPQPALESASAAIVKDIDLPLVVLDRSVSIDNVVQRFPNLAAEFESLDLTGEPEGEQAETGATATPSAADPDSAEPDSGADLDTSGHVAAAVGASAPVGGGSGEQYSGAVESDDADAGESDERDSGARDSGGSASGLPESIAEHDDSSSSDLARTGAEARDVRTAALASKLLLNIFATGSGAVSAEQLSGWQADANWLRRALGPEGCGAVRGVLGELESGLVGRMRLREVLADPRLAAQLTPSMSLVEQLLRDKHNLSGVALANAKALIRRYVEEVAQVLRTQVQQSSVGTVDRSVPPKRILRNLDTDRTIWKNLPNWNPEDQRLYVDRLYYKHSAKRTTPARMIVVVDQSGSMTDSMVNCTILASIFAGLPKVDVHLIAYDTRALDLTPWVHDPFEVLLRTNLGGGNDGPVAMAMAQPKITDPRNTVLVWISDFYEFDRSQPLFQSMEAVHRSGVKLIPVGSVNSSNQQSVNPWFRERFKALGTPVISGRIQKLVDELKNFLD